MPLAGRLGCLAYGALAYAGFLAWAVYAIGFVGNFWSAFGWDEPWLRSMDFGGPVAPPGEALAVDGALILLFGLQHSVMARPAFKKWWTRIVPAPLERSTYVLSSTLCLFLLFFAWRPLGTTILWDLSAGPAGALMLGLSLAGWLVVVLSTFMLDHLELFGLRQVWSAFRGRTREAQPFSTPAFYRMVRHPIYAGFIVAFWATPIMTLGHLVFAAGTTIYVLIAIPLEERDLVHHFGDAYREYRRRVRALLPLPGRERGAPERPG